MSVKLRLRILFAISTILLFFALMLSTTWALFTDEGRENVRVTAGQMDIGLRQADSRGVYHDIAGEDGDVFGEMPWEPAQTRVVFFKIENNSDIRVKYSFQLNVDIGGLEGALEYSAYESEFFDVKTTNWETISEEYPPVVLNHGVNVISGDKYVAMAPGEARYYAVAVHMPPNSSNIYQGQECVIDVAVFAVQGNANV